jgi:hypothetical protein
MRFYLARLEIRRSGFKDRASRIAIGGAFPPRFSAPRRGALRGLAWPSSRCGKLDLRSIRYPRGDLSFSSRAPGRRDGIIASGRRKNLRPGQARQAAIEFGVATPEGLGLARFTYLRVEPG